MGLVEDSCPPIHSTGRREEKGGMWTPQRPPTRSGPDLFHPGPAFKQDSQRGRSMDESTGELSTPDPIRILKPHL